MREPPIPWEKKERVRDYNQGTKGSSVHIFRGHTLLHTTGFKADDNLKCL
jgi:hypothetical protein